jgi:hypothetical protein
MKEFSLTFRDYSTPSSADVLLNAYRRFLDTAATKTRNAGLASVADAVVGTGNYGDDAPRSEMLDRYNTHTVNCPVCLTTLKKARRSMSRIQALKTAMLGAAGASATALATLAVASRLAAVALNPAV